MKRILGTLSVFAAGFILFSMRWWYNPPGGALEYLWAFACVYLGPILMFFGGLSALLVIVNSAANKDMSKRPHIRRYIFGTLSVLSLLLTLATVGLWVVSHWRSFGWVYISVEYENNIYHKSTRVWMFKTGGISKTELVFHNPNYIDVERTDLSFHTSQVIAIDWKRYWFTLESETSPDIDGFPREYFTMTIPFWFFALAFAVMPTIWFIKRRRLRNLAIFGKCPNCAYDLTGNETGVCPECGQSIEQA